MRDLNDLASFAAVVAHRGFAPAARALGQPKSSLSRHVARLEERLGVRLLERSTRRFAVTSIGEEVFRQAQAAMAAADAVEEVVARRGAEPRGTVRVSCPPGLLPGGLTAVLPRFLAAYPQLRLDLVVTNRRIDLIEEGIDIAIRVRRRLDTDANFQMRSLGRSRSILVASPALLDRLGRPRSPDELSRLPGLSPGDGRDGESWDLEAIDGRKETVAITPRIVCLDFTLLLRAAIAGMGVSLLPEGVCGAAVRRGELEQVLPDWHGGEGLIHLVFTSRRGMLPAVRAFIDFLAGIDFLVEAWPAEDADLMAATSTG